MNLLKKALIQLPPETIKMWQWVKTKYAQRVFSTLKPSLSRSTAEKIRQEISTQERMLSNVSLVEIYRANNLDDEKALVSKWNLDYIPYYFIKDETYTKGYITISTKEQKNLPKESPVWRLAIFSDNIIHGATEREDIKFSQVLHAAINLLSRSFDGTYKFAEEYDFMEQTVLFQKVQKDSQNKSLHTLNHKATVTTDISQYGITFKPSIELFIKETSNYEFQGEWDKTKTGGKIVIYVLPTQLAPTTAAEYSLNLVQLKRALEHEVRHMIQTLINKSKNIETSGLSKFPNPEYDPDGYKKQYKALREKLKNRSIAPTDITDITEAETSRLPHTLRDIEFHTRLADSIADFNDQKLKFPKSDWLRAAKTFIGMDYPIFKLTKDWNSPIIKIDTFFQALKKDAAEKQGRYEYIKEDFQEAKKNPRLYPPTFLKDLSYIYKQFARAKSLYLNAVKQFIKETLI